MRGARFAALGRRRRPVAFLVVAVVLLTPLLTSCAGSGDSGRGPSQYPHDEAAALTYGYGPKQDGSVTYKSDVVLIQGGPGVIRSASGNGLVWTVDGDAEGVSNLELGKVMYATSRAVGRVAALEADGDDVAVTLAPVGLTDVFEDAHFQGVYELGKGSLAYQEVPDLPGAVSVPEENGQEIPELPGALSVPGESEEADPPAPVDGTAAAEGSAASEEVLVIKAQPIRFTTSNLLLPDASKHSFKVSVGGWSFEPSLNARGRGHQVGLKVGTTAVEGKGDWKGLKMFVDFNLDVENLRVRTDTRIANGRLVGEPMVLLEGVKGFSLGIAAGVADGLASNTKVLIEVPMELSEQIPGQPLVAHISFKFVATTALTGRNSTLEAGGKWALNGPMGVRGGKTVVPDFTVTRSIIESIGGISVGVSGTVVAIEAKTGVGIGVPLFFAGPFVKLAFSVGITNGSALGVALRCVGAALKVSYATGFGLSLSSEFKKALQALLPPKTKLDVSTEQSTTIVEKSQILPDSPLCTEGLRQ